MPSIVIPAHNEEPSIAALLRALTPLAVDTEIVVVGNGCRDRTVPAARAAAPWATVLDLPEPGKPGALNAGDRAAASFPRMYLDADVRIDATAVRRIFAALGPDRPAAAATPHYDTTGSSLMVRSHQRFWELMPANQRGLAGTNAMALSRAGRARFIDWPGLIGDDYFLDGLFDATEKLRVPEAIVIRPTATGFTDCVSRKARIHQGNLDIRAAELRPAHSGGGAGGVAAVLRRHPWAGLDLPAHLAITIAARVLSWWRRRRGTAQVWFRDESRTKRGR